MPQNETIDLYWATGYRQAFKFWAFFDFRVIAEYSNETIHRSQARNHVILHILSLGLGRKTKPEPSLDINVPMYWPREQKCILPFIRLIHT